MDSNNQQGKTQHDQPFPPVKPDESFPQTTTTHQIDTTTHQLQDFNEQSDSQSHSSQSDNDSQDENAAQNNDIDLRTQIAAQ